MFGTWLALGAAAMLTASHTRVDAALDAAAQARSAASGSDASVAAALEVEPSIAARTRSGALLLQGRYGPRLLLSSADSSQVLGARHEAELSLEWSPAPRWLVTHADTFTFGRSDVLTTPDDDDDPLDALEAQLTPVPDLLASSAELGLHHQLAPGVTVLSAVSWWIYGALSESSQRLFPLQHGPGLLVGTQHDLSRNDQLRTQLYAGHTFVSGGEGTSVVHLSETWRRLLSPSLRIEARAGAGAVYEPGSPGENWAVLPLAAVRVERDFLWRTERVESFVEALLGPSVSPWSGVLQQQAEASARVQWQLRERWWLRGRAALARQVWTGDTPPEALGMAELVAKHRFRPRVELQGGVRAGWGEIPALSASLGWQWLAFTSLTLTEEDVL